MPFAFGALAFVEAPGGVTVADADQRGGVEDALEAAVVAPWSVQVAADAARVPGRRGDAGHACQAVGGAIAAHVTGGRGEELGAHQRADAGHALDHFGEAVLAKPGRNELVDFDELLVEAHHLLRQGVDHLRGDFLPRKRSLLPLGRVEDRLGQGLGPADLAVPEPGLQPFAAGATQGGGCLVSGQKDQRADVTQIEFSFKGGKDAGQLAAQAIDPPGAVGADVRPAASENAQFEGVLVVGPQRGQVPAHAGLVGDDRGVLGVSLAGASVAGGGPVDRQTGYVDELLAVIEQEVDPQGCHAVGDVDRPDHVLVDGHHVDEKGQELRLVIEHPPRQQPRAVGIEHHAMVVGLAYVRPRPDQGHLFLRSFDMCCSSGRPRQRGPTQRCTRKGPAAPNQRPSRRETPGGQVSRTIKCNRLKAIPGVFGPLDLTTARPTHQQRRTD